MKVMMLVVLLLLEGLISCQSGNDEEKYDIEGGNEQNDIKGCQAWQDFVEANEQNVLLDFSYAGYKHGEEEPPENIWELGYKKYDITKYGAIPNDGKSDREAFKRILEELQITGKKQNPNARAVIYFPEGEFILYSAEEDGTTEGGTETMEIRAGNIILKGAGRDKTYITMKDPYLPADGEVAAGYMIRFRNWSGFRELTKIVGDTDKGDYSVEVASTAGISSGDWVCLKLEDNSSELIANELKPYSLSASMTQIQNDGVQVYDIHQVKSVHGNIVTFVEPIMHEIDCQWNWQLCNYSYYENIGVEDLSFKGNTSGNFVHDQWTENTAYMPLGFMRVVNTWVRRVNFHSVSEATSFIYSANVSVYDVLIDGNRGHTNVHADSSSRLFLGNITDFSDIFSKKGVGQWHATGVTKRSIGTVIWNCKWGTDSNFESHATQPRATLIDCCTGGFLQMHQGGATDQLPNHLDDLTLWNFNATNVLPDEANEWRWWDDRRGWKFLPPTIVGFHGAEVHFVQEQVKLNADQGKIVEPFSLYEAQLIHRLGYVPTWLTKLK